MGNGDKLSYMIFSCHFCGIPVFERGHRFIREKSSSIGHGCYTGIISEISNEDLKPEGIFIP